MLIEYVVESLDQVDESVRAAYVEADGKFQLDADKYAEAKAAGLKKKNAELLGKLKNTESTLGKFKRFEPLAEAFGDADDEEITGFLEAYRNRQNGGGGENGKNGGGDQKQLEMAQKLHEKQLKKVNDDLAAIRAEHEKTQRALKEYQLWTPLRELFLKGNGDASEWELARLDLANQQRFGFDDENKIVVLEDGMPSSVTPEQFFKSVYADQRPKFYKASDAGGSGANPRQANSGGKTKTMKRADWNALPDTKRAAFFKEGGQLVD